MLKLGDLKYKILTGGIFSKLWIFFVKNQVNMKSFSLTVSLICMSIKSYNSSTATGIKI